MAQYAYIRVSTREQNVDRQLIALEGFDIPPKYIFCDHQSGKDFNRPAYQKLVRKLRKGDLVIIKSIDRLGRNYDDILSQWQHITKDLQADIKVLDMPLLDTRSKDGDLTGELIADMVLQILAYVAHREREFIHTRQAEGIAAARAKGKRLGRKPMEIPNEFPKVWEEWTAGVITVRQAAERLGVSHSTFCRWSRRYENEVEK